MNPDDLLIVTVRANWGMISYTKTYSYTGAAQKIEIPYDGYYKVELWGASGNWDAYSKGHTYGMVVAKVFLHVIVLVAAPLVV